MVVFVLRLGRVHAQKDILDRIVKEACVVKNAYTEVNVYKRTLVPVGEGTLVNDVNIVNASLCLV